jgi:hypothetical protein
LSGAFEAVDVGTTFSAVFGFAVFYWKVMASKGLRSSHAISMILSIWLSVKGTSVLGALMMGFTLFIVCNK